MLNKFSHHVYNFGDERQYGVLQQYGASALTVDNSVTALRDIFGDGTGIIILALRSAFSADVRSYEY
jgi:hypothetical protein